MSLIRPYGLLIALGIAAGWLVMAREERRMGLPRDTGMDLILHALVPALVGARLYYVLFAWEAFRQEPVRALYLWDGGLAIYGAVIGGALGGLYLARRRKIPFTELADLAAPALLLGQAIGRWGNFINREAYGSRVTEAFWQFFPAAVQVDGEWYLATFFYESLWNLAGFLFLARGRRRFRAGGRSGHVFLWYLIWYGFGRFLIEGLRSDSLMWGSLRVSQMLSLLLCAGGVLLAARRLKAALPAALAAAALLAGGLSRLLIPVPLLLASAALLVLGAVFLDRRYRIPDGAEGSVSRP